jgi:membrane-bound ClpP family serine protease
MKNYTIEQILGAIQDSLGIMSTIAEELGCDWSTAKKYVNMYEETRVAYANEEERAKDIAEQTIHKAISLDDREAAKWYLSKKGKDRGYGDRMELTGANGADLIPAKQRTVQITVVRAKDGESGG